MKKLLFALVLAAAMFAPRAQAVAIINPPYLGSISNEVFNQLTVVTNEIAATNNVAANKKLLKVLLGANKLIAKTKTNHVGGAKSLGVLNKSLGRSSLSNNFNPLIQGTADIYVSVFDDILDALEARVNSSYPGRSQDAARKALAKFELAIRNADTNSNFLLVLKALSAAAKGEVGAQKATVKAEAAPAPPNGFSATISASNEGTFAYKPILQSVNGVYDSVLDRIHITSFELKVSGGFSNLKTQNRTIEFILPNIPGSGTYTYNLTSPNLLALYTITRSSGVGVGTTITYDEQYNVNDVDPGDINQGTLTVTFDSVTKLAYGSFSFKASGDSNPANTATVNGSFSITTLP